MKNYLYYFLVMTIVLIFLCNPYANAHNQMGYLYDDHYQKNCKYIGEYKGEDWYIHLGDRSNTCYAPKNENGDFYIEADILVFKNNELYEARIIHNAHLIYGTEWGVGKISFSGHEHDIYAVIDYNGGPGYAEKEFKRVYLDLSDPNTVEFIIKVSKLTIEYGEEKEL